MSKETMCGKKMVFRTRSFADKVALERNQRVYECPVCYCFHLTSKENWRQEFVAVEVMDQKIAEARSAGRREGKEKIKELNIQVQDLLRKNKQLRMENHELRTNLVEKQSES